MSLNMFLKKSTAQYTDRIRAHPEGRGSDPGPSQKLHQSNNRISEAYKESLSCNPDTFPPSIGTSLIVWYKYVEQLD